MSFDSLHYAFNSTDTTSSTAHKNPEVLHEIVEGFSCCNLTREEDKLVALLQSRFIDCCYIAGPWKQCLPTSLLWVVSEDRQKNGLPTRCPK